MREFTGSSPAVVYRPADPAQFALTPETAERLHAHGFDGIEWALHSLAEWMAVVADAEKRLSEAPACALHADRRTSGAPIRKTSRMETPVRTDFGALKPLIIAASAGSIDPDHTAADLGRLLPFASRIGAQCVNVTILPVTATESEYSFRGLKEALNFAHQLLRQIRFDAERAGVPLALEACASGCLLSPVELRELIDAAHSWAVAACVDLDRTAGLVDAPPNRHWAALCDWLEILRHRVLAVRVSAGRVWRAVGTPSDTHDLALSLSDILKGLKDRQFGGLLVVTGELADDETARAAALLRQARKG